ncbi:MAG: DUF4149 domain-containing protein [Microcoleus sp. PH2017_29_MFU_D_A]|jgi:hypothetical protein|uniref:DUF4149 domain-containing protein n=1 Tax=unclassified Microcoleus TaxID=2642155 RepID=UPI001D7CB4CC|nr:MULTISPECIES: DUF4149 domain-containing protein [unclassified Microcoleus]MCC3501572.1 DUF4149 domain-containing protein [Microcoleus sp. PH2017_19_SFW_U_A]MCC3507733.1 DUF4149 domain-containing protein [Microcoleus sp. PH2017_17_BER_D_A]TAE56979.1 MAG: DUF4149 domain-containing protein [Oscillatoriales cyanobacterium]MCC3520534.1 DUF4149 domain-containing protein [Microcoleus sp. PH2017_20_SFW_D_A]MCC3551632.1 DUF4149 domain-containing protein [Microcoleus sp. PH2017_35_SFW_U_B]
MTAITSSRVESIRPRWQAIVMVALIFWLSGSLIIDLVIMPSLYVSGMMVSSDFATAGNLMFWGFNRVELICSGFVATGLMVLSNLMGDSGKRTRTAIVLSLVLLAIALVDTYGLTPQMSALGMQLNLFDSAAEVPAGMNTLHQGYFVLEALKLAVGGTLLGWCYQNEV